MTDNAKGEFMADSNIAPTSSGDVAKTKPTEVFTRPLRVLVATSLGTAGKSTIAENVVLPALGSKGLYVVESPSVGKTLKYGVPVDMFTASDMRAMHRQMMGDTDPVILDLGASDFGNFVTALHAANVLPAFDYCILIATPTERGQAAVLTTYETFRKFGMPQHKFRVLLNRVDMSFDGTDESVRDQFSILFRHADENPGFWIQSGCMLPELNDLFIGLKDAGMSLGQALEDKTDYDELAYTRSRQGDVAGTDDATMRGVVCQVAMGAQAYFERAFKLLDLRPRKATNGAA
jgi:hypothetical protein